MLKDYHNSWHLFCAHGTIVRQFQNHLTTGKMKKTCLTVLFYCLLGLVFYSCCKDQHKLIGSHSVGLTGSVTNDSLTGLEKITGAFSIIDYHSLDFASNFAEFGIQQAYATQPCDINLVSPILIDEMELYFDQPLTLDSVSIPASYNLFSDATFKKHLDVFHDTYRGSSSLQINLDSAFFTPPIFANGPMNIQFVTKTEDGTSFVTELDVIVEF